MLLCLRPVHTDSAVHAVGQPLSEHQLQEQVGSSKVKLCLSSSHVSFHSASFIFILFYFFKKVIVCVGDLHFLCTNITFYCTACVFIATDFLFPSFSSLSSSSAHRQSLLKECYPETAAGATLGVHASTEQLPDFSSGQRVFS